MSFRGGGGTLYLFSSSVIEVILIKACSMIKMNFHLAFSGIDFSLVVSFGRGGSFDHLQRFLEFLPKLHVEKS